MKQKNKAPLTLTIGTTLFSGLIATAIDAKTHIEVAANPFAMTELSGGYMQTAEAETEQEGDMKMKDGSCGEGKCGGKKNETMSKGKEGKCGDKKADVEAKGKEGSCGDKK